MKKSFTLAGIVIAALLCAGWATNRIVSVAISSSTIDSTPIGATTPATGVFTNLYADTEAFAAALAVTNNATVGGTLGVIGASTLTGNTSVGGTLGVTGNTSLSTVSTSGLANLHTFNVNGSAPSNHFLCGNGTVYADSAASCTASTVSSGYQLLPGGLILEWGQYTETSGSSATVSFPQHFPTALLSLSLTSGPSTDIRDATSINSQSTSGFEAATTGSTIGFSWIAVGN